MLLFQCAWENVKCHVGDFFHYFITLSFTVTFIFFYMSFQYHEKFEHALSLSTSLRVGEMLLFVCLCISGLYIIITGFKKRMVELKSYMLAGMSRKHIMIILLYEQLIVGGGAFILGLFHGMLFLRLFAAALVKVTGCQDMKSISITFEAVIHTTLLFTMFILLAMWRCYLFVFRDEVLR